MKTERLVATPTTDRDLVFLYRLWQDPRVAMSLGGLRSRARLEPLFRRMIGDWDRLGLGSWVVRLRPDGPPIGRVGLHPTSAGGRESIELGYALLPEYWGQGHATEISRAAIRFGFDGVGLAEVVAFTMTTNAASRRVLEKAGLTYEREFMHAGWPHAYYRVVALV